MYEILVCTVCGEPLTRRSLASRMFVVFVRLYGICSMLSHIGGTPANGKKVALGSLMLLKLDTDDEEDLF